MHFMKSFALLASFLFVAVGFAAEPAPWSTYRGNNQRTGNTDGKAGPEKPAVLWHIASQDHYVASLVPLGEQSIYASGIGALNRPSISVLPVADGKKATWSRSAPYLRLLSVSSPATNGKFIVFGDGMHQDSGGVLHCLTADTGRPVWQLSLEGNLIHLEGSPAIAEGKVYMGGGAAGVLCVDLNTALIDGKAVTAPEIAAMQEAKWKQLQAAYEAKKKQDPDLAVPPTEDDLLKPAPKLLWQKGKEKWHVDAPVCVVVDKVLVCTSYLDKEKAGERALYCLDAKTGDTIWSSKLVYNPWGGVAVSGDTVIVTGSTVGYYFNELRGAKGDISAFDLKTGKALWHKDTPGGIVATAALAGDMAITTATDGKVRAFGLKDGERRWIYDTRGPLFAPPAVAVDRVYIGDLKGAIHAIELKTGVPKWQLDLGTDAVVKSPGMIYGGITIHNGKLFVGSVNLEGPNVKKSTFIACIGTK